jgi:glyoxylase-like metal-dependent hydrolase (beta-lactamase superfamily II)
MFMWTIDVLIQGFPGKAVCHGGLGWSTIALLRDRAAKRTMLIDVGAFGVRRMLGEHLKAHDVDPASVTDVVLTHAHYDHSVNYTLFPNATLWIGAKELAWAERQPPGFNPLPELYVRDLAQSPRTRRVEDGQEFMPGLTAHMTPGHTPGSLVFLLQNGDTPVLFTGDAAKNRAELLSLEADMSYDPSISRGSFERIWSLWRQKPGTLLIPGHDLTMKLDAQGRPEYVGERRASMLTWFGESIHETTEIDLCCAPKKVLPPL